LPLGIDYYPLDYSADLDMRLARLIFGNPLFEVSPFADFVGVAGLSLLYSSANASANGAFADWVGRSPSISNPSLLWEHFKASSAEHMLASVGVGGAFLVKADWASVAVEYGFFLLRWGSSIAFVANCPSFGVMSDISVGVNVLSASLAVAESAGFLIFGVLLLLGILLGFILLLIIIAGEELFLLRRSMRVMVVAIFAIFQRRIALIIKLVSAILAIVKSVIVGFFFLLLNYNRRIGAIDVLFSHLNILKMGLDVGDECVLVGATLGFGDVILRNKLGELFIRHFVQVGVHFRS
tara:strand:- start:1658 stop:2542 length:885 start_codon:yes stop_codon:yes gene_type:complete